MRSSQTTKLDQKQTDRDSSGFNYQRLFGWAIFAAFLVWMSAPTVKQNLDWHKQLRSKDRMSDIVRAQLRFQKENGRLPNNQNGLSWRVHLLPYLGQSRLYQKFDLSKPWDSPHNIKLLKQMPDIYNSEGLVKKLDRGKTAFLRPVGNGAFPMPGSADDASFSTRSITKELSQTVFLVEINPDQAVNWTQPRDHFFDPENPKKHLGRARLVYTNICLGNGAIWDMTSDNKPKDVKAKFTTTPETLDLAFDSTN